MAKKPSAKKKTPKKRYLAKFVLTAHARLDELSQQEARKIVNLHFVNDENVFFPCVDVGLTEEGNLTLIRHIDE